MKKLFAILMSIMMIACFMPTMAFAEEPGTPAAQIITFKNIENNSISKNYGDPKAEIAVCINGQEVTKTNVSSFGKITAAVEGETDAVEASFNETNYKLELTFKKATQKAVTVKVSAATKGEAAAEGSLAEGSANLTVTVAPKELTGIDVSKVTVTKTYDGKTTAGNVSGKIEIKEKVGEDDVSITAKAGEYADQYAGNGKTVTLTLTLDGTAKDNYTLGQGGDTKTINTASITAAEQTITPDALSLKVGNTLDLSTAFHSDAEGAVITYVLAKGQNETVSIDEDGKTLRGLKAGEATINVSASAVDLNEDNDNVPEYAEVVSKPIQVTVSNKTEISGDYITFEPQNVTYGDDYTPNVATLKGNVGESDGVWTYSYAGKDATTYGPSNVPPTNAGTYTVTATYKSENKLGTATATLTIAKKDLHITGVSVADKVYDGTNTATIEGTPMLNAEDIVAGDAEQLELVTTDATATFADVNAGMDKTVNVNGYTLTGAADANYTLKQPTEVTAAITPKPLTATATVEDKPYDGNSSAKAEVTFDGLVTVGENTETLTPTTDYTVNAYFLDGPDVGTSKDVVVEVVLKKEENSVAKNYVLDLKGEDYIPAKATIKKATQNPAPAVAVTVQKKTYGFVDIHSAIEADGVIGEISVPADKAAFFTTEGKPSVNTKGLLEFTLSADASTEEASNTVEITVPVENARNYENYNITVTVTVSDAEQVNVSAPRALDRVYDGTRKPLVEAGVTSAGTMQYSSTENGEYTEAIPEAKNAKDSYTVYYKVVKDGVDVSDDKAKGSVPVTIEKAPVTVQPKSFTIKQGDALPTLVLEYVGLIGKDELIVDEAYQPTFKYMQGENDVTGEPKEVGTYTIKWTNASAEKFTNTNYDVEVIDTATLTIEVKPPASSGGGSYYPYTPSTPSKPAAPNLDKTKTDSTAALNAAATANKYDAAEQAEVKKILDKANADIKNAKTEAEVKAIEEAAQAEIDKILTTEEKAIVAALDNVEKRDFATKSKVITRKGGKKVIRLTWTAPDGVDVDGYEIFRSTKKNSGFGKKPYFATSNTSYTNTKALKAGKTYYYKVRAFVVINGERVYTDYSLKAYRKL